MGELERRAAGDLEWRAGAGSDEPPRVEGYAAVFNFEAEIAGMFREVIAPGAFGQALERGDDVVLLVDHKGQPLARTRSGTLTLREDERGLWVQSELDPEDPDVQRLAPKLRRGDMDKMSFAFRVEEEEWEYPDGQLPLRTIKRVALHDVSIVTFPVYDATEVGLRARVRAAEVAALAARSRRERRLRLAVAELGAAAPAATP